PSDLDDPGQVDCRASATGFLFVPRVLVASRATRHVYRCARHNIRCTQLPGATSTMGDDQSVALWSTRFRSPRKWTPGGACGPGDLHSSSWKFSLSASAASSLIRTHDETDALGSLFAGTLDVSGVTRDAHLAPPHPRGRRCRGRAGGLPCAGEALRFPWRSPL